MLGSSLRRKKRAILCFPNKLLYLQTTWYLLELNTYENCVLPHFLFSVVGHLALLLSHNKQGRSSENDMSYIEIEETLGISGSTYVGLLACRLLNTRVILLNKNINNISRTDSLLNSRFPIITYSLTDYTHYNHLIVKRAMKTE